MNQRIVKAILDALAGKIPVETRPMYCLKVVRQIVEAAMGWAPGEFYRRYLTHRVEENTTNVPWARDMERSLRRSGFEVANPVAGALVFSHVTARPYGHVGILLTPELVFENSPTPRGWRHTRHNLQLVPFNNWVPLTGIMDLENRKTPRGDAPG